MEGLVFKTVNELLRVLDLISRLLDESLCFRVLLLSIFQLAVDLRELFPEVISLLLKKHGV